MYEAEMMPKTRRRLRRLLWILGTAVLVLFMGYKAGFGSLGRSDRDDSMAHKAARAGHVPRSKFPVSNLKGFHSRQSSQKERQKSIKNFCKQTGHAAEPNPSDITVNESLKMIYCITPKCASRALRLMLFPSVNGINVPRVWRCPPHERDMMLETFFKFTFVREPFERILSAYKDKFVHPRKYDRPILEFHGREILKNFCPNASQSAFEKLNDITFREFIEYLVTKGSNRSTPVMDRHWDNYVNICGLCAVKYDFIGHYETMEEDLADLVTAAGLSSEDAKRFVAYKQKASDTSFQLLKYYSQIPREWIDILGRIFRANFEMFGYSFPGPLKGPLTYIFGPVARDIYGYIVLAIFLV